MHPSKLPSQAHLNNVFLSYMQNSDEYLQHPGIGTTGRKKKRTTTHYQPTPTRKCNHSQNAPQTNCSGCRCPATIPRRCSAQAHVKRASSLLRVCIVRIAVEMENEMWGGSKSGSKVQMAVTLKSIWSTVCGIFPCVPALDVRLPMNQLIRLREPRDLGVFMVSGQFYPSVYCPSMRQTIILTLENLKAVNVWVERGGPSRAHPGLWLEPEQPAHGGQLL